MKEYTIKPIKTGSILYYRGAFTSNQEQYKVKEEFPVLIFLIEGNGKKILVDTGCGDPLEESMKRINHGPGSRSPEEAPDVALRSLGVEPDEIESVILTHLHWDHCYNNHLFPRAQFYVQRQEMISAVAPLPKFQKTYESFLCGVVPPWARQNTRWNYVDGDYELMDGIRLIYLPGHTLGLQGVLVNTKKGPHLLASDMVPLYENISGEAFAVSSLCVDLVKQYESVHKMESLNAEIIPSHDYLTLKRGPFPAPLY